MKSYIFNFLSLSAGKKAIYSIIAPSEQIARAKLCKKNDRLLLVRRERNSFPTLHLATTFTALSGFGVWYA
nr:MAG TPA: hypothetical protein [Caudoviricetes sp.]